MESRADRLQARLAHVAGFDLPRAMQNVGGHMAILERMLRRFVGNYANGLPELLEPQRDEPLAQWRAAAHSLRGACHVVGATALADSVAGFERALDGAAVLDAPLKDQARSVNDSLQALARDLQAALVT